MTNILGKWLSPFFLDESLILDTHNKLIMIILGIMSKGAIVNIQLLYWKLGIVFEAM